MLVRGHRVPYVPEEVADEASNSLFGNSLHTNYILWVAVGLVLTGAFIAVLVIRDRKLRRKLETSDRITDKDTETHDDES